MVYFTSSVVIVNYFKIYKQQHFLHHRKEVCSIAVSQSGLVASGERGSNPTVFIWRIKDLTPIHAVTSIHNADVYLLRFMNDDAHLISIGKRLDSSVVVVDVKTGNTIYACCLNEFIRGISTIDFQISQIIEEQSFSNNRRNFFVYSQSSIYFFSHDYSPQSYAIVKHDKDAHAYEEQLAAITCVRAVLKSSSSSILLSLAADWLITLLTGHSDGKVCIWTVDYDNMAIRSERILCFYNAFVTDIVVTSIGYAICTNDMGVHVWDLDMTNSVKEVDLNTLGLRLNAKLKNVVPSENKLFFLTLESEMFSVDLFISPAWSKNMFVYKYEIQAIDSIFTLGEDMRAVKMIERVDAYNTERREAGTGGRRVIERANDKPERT